MAKSNAELQKDKRAKEKALLEKIGAVKRTFIMTTALENALSILGERHDFEEWQETQATFLINLAAAPAEESARFATMSRHEITISENMSRKIEETNRKEALRSIDD